MRANDSVKDPGETLDFEDIGVGSEGLNCSFESLVCPTVFAGGRWTSVVVHVSAKDAEDVEVV